MPQASIVQQKEKGFVAIIVCMTITIILGVLTLGFAQLMQREQRQALDRQLSTQAFYAAESGANYAIKKDFTQQDTCFSGGPLDNGPGKPQTISYPCLLVKNDPFELIFDDINSNNPTVFNINNTVDELTVSWQRPDGTTTAPWTNDSYPSFPTAANWSTRVGVAEIVIYPIKGAVNTADLQTSARTFYLYPSTGGGSVDYSQDAQVVAGNCTTTATPRHCNVTITGLGGLGANGYVIRLRSIYNPVAVQIGGKVGGASVRLIGAQRVIDSTGKASDVLRRIQIRVPIRAGFNLPSFVVETTDALCKQLQTEPNSSSDSCP